MNTEADRDNIHYSNEGFQRNCGAASVGENYRVYLIKYYKLSW